MIPQQEEGLKPGPILPTIHKQAVLSCYKCKVGVGEDINKQTNKQTNKHMERPSKSLFLP